MKRILGIIVVVLVLSLWGPSVVEPPWPKGAEERYVGGGFPFRTEVHYGMGTGFGSDTRTDQRAILLNFVINLALLSMWVILRRTHRLLSDLITKAVSKTKEKHMKPEGE